MLVERGELNREASGTNAGSFHFQIAHPPADRARDAATCATACSTEVRLHAEAAEVWETLERELDGAARHPHHRRADGRRDPRGAAAAARQARDRAGGRARDARARGRRAARRSRRTSPTTCSARPTARTRDTRTRCSPRRSSRCAPVERGAVDPHACGGDAAIEAPTAARAASRSRPRRARFARTASSTPPAPGPTTSPS